MSQHSIIKRYTLIIDKVKYSKYPTKKEMIDYLFDEGFDISSRTLDRDIKSIRNEFGVALTYDKNYSGYYIDQENSINIDTFFKFLELANTAELLQQSLSESKMTLRYISFDANNNLKGIHHLKNLLKAVREHRIIEFSYTKFNDHKAHDHILEPYLLREYQNRWYVIGKDHKRKYFGTFGIDRINDLTISEDTFEYDEEDDPTGMFKYVIGLNYSQSSLQDVILSFVPDQADYIKTLPLHKTQKILADNDKEFRIKIQVIPNFEFEQKILMHGERVKVIEPRSLADQIKIRLKKALTKYS